MAAQGRARHGRRLGLAGQTHRRSGHPGSVQRDIGRSGDPPRRMAVLRRRPVRGRGRARCAERRGRGGELGGQRPLYGRGRNGRCPARCAPRARRLRGGSFRRPRSAHPAVALRRHGLERLLRTDRR